MMPPQDRARTLFDGDVFAKTLGIEFIRADNDAVVLGLTVTANHCNVHGKLHGAVSYALADISFAIASNLAGPAAVAVDVHMVYSGAARKGDKIVAMCTELRRGRTLATYRSDIKLGDKLLGSFTGTVLITGATDAV